MDEYDEIPEGVEAGTLEYWRSRARQWQRRCQRAEREKTRLIAELNAAKVEAAKLRADRRTFVTAVGDGDLQPTARDHSPRLPRGWK